MDGSGADPWTLSWLLQDHLGSTSVTTDAGGSKVAELRYMPFGETRYEWGSTSTDYRYTGQLEEGEIGLMFYNARWYDPQIGRFTSADSVVPGVGNVLAYDRYSYVFNNPVKYIDPSGHCPVCAEIALHLLLWLLERDLQDGSFDTPTDVRTTVVATKETLAGNPLGQYRDQNLATTLSSQPGSEAPNMTIWLVDTMNANASGSIAGTLAAANAGNPAEKYAASLGWAALVKGGAPWDFKEDFGREKIGSVTLGGNQFNMDVVANIHYGFVGAASGFSTEELLVGAGVAQVTGGTSEWAYWNSNFDDPKDQNAIRLGIWLYEQYGAKLTAEQFIEALNGYRNNLRQAE